MAEINNSIALQVQPNYLDLGKTLSTAAQLQMSQAHASLYNQQAQYQQARMNALQSGDINQLAKIDPAMAGEMVGYKQKQADMAGRIAAGYLANPTEDSRNSAVNAAVEAGLFTPLQGQQARGVPLGQFTNFAKQFVASGMPAQTSEEQSGRPGAAQVMAKAGPEAYAAGLKSAAELPGKVATEATTAGLTASREQGTPFNPSATATDVYNRTATGLGGGAVPPGASVNGLGDAARAVSAMPEGPQRTQAWNQHLLNLYSGNKIDENQYNQYLDDASPKTVQRLMRSATTPGRGYNTNTGTFTPKTPAQIKEENEDAEQLGKLPQTFRDAATAAGYQNNLIDQMRVESQSWRMGKWATAEGNARASISALVNNLPKAVTESPGVKQWVENNLNKPMADFEAFGKNAMELTREVVRATSSRAAVQEFQMIQQALPGVEMSKGGFEKVADQLQGINDYNIARSRAALMWKGAHGSMAGFNEAWTENVSPTLFMLKRIEATDPNALVAMKTNLEKTPQGQALLKSLGKQLGYAYDNGILK